MATFTIRGKNIEITPALHDYVEKKVGKVTKYFDTVGEITVLLTVTKGQHIVEVTVPVQGILLRGEESTMDMYTSIDLVIEKLERQIRKQKTKLERRFRSGSFKMEAVAAANASARDEAEDKDDEYPVVKTKRFAVKPMDVQEAIMQMNLINHEFFVFRDAKTEDVNVVYRRRDGNYGLIEPSR
ncbi:ribosome hibernation-promoting factor, HPF/YfiA family [Pectinatus cerevisiiphilus]|uniref:Ribosome hibernation promoting factor n=1 Tax=Pectinatus cerevisiiphilus TaxID=86956 RepID=A0A4R3K569_9FIRM|nr:ribosome-associated translation inhibitor RaiA [Pectinatus cerevisiiphilus]TCS77811.1 putative sigma-54 modulation protein [Pectinatus cerevisiiphilus]